MQQAEQRMSQFHPTFCFRLLNLEFVNLKYNLQLRILKIYVLLVSDIKAHYCLNISKKTLFITG